MNVMSKQLQNIIDRLDPSMKQCYLCGRFKHKDECEKHQSWGGDGVLTHNKDQYRCKDNINCESKVMANARHMRIENFTDNPLDILAVRAEGNRCYIYLTRVLDGVRMFGTRWKWKYIRLVNGIKWGLEDARSE